MAKSKRVSLTKTQTVSLTKSLTKTLMKSMNKTLGAWVCLALGCALAGGLARAEEKKVDGAEPALLQGLARCTPEEQAAGALLLLDGKTFFGWRAEPVQFNGRMRVGTPRPLIAMRGGQTRITTQVPIKITTELLLQRPWKIELTYHTEEETTASVEVHDHSNMYIKRFASALENSSEPKTLVITAEGEGGGPIAFDGQLVDESGTIKENGRTALRIIVRGGTLVIDRLVMYPGWRTILDSSLAGWTARGETTAEPVQEPGAAVRLCGGKGFLESSEEFDDFYLSLTFKENASPNNSGLFFRTIPQSEMNGYEAQMNNSPPQEDRGKFLGNDTGSIFRLSPARRLIDDPRGWNRLTVMAQADLMRTWVNGVPALIWSDDRAADENPRKGRRFKRGTIQIQGHDPSTDLLLGPIQVLDRRNKSTLP